MVELLNDPRPSQSRFTLTSYGPENHAVQSEQYRYYRYEGGAEELYDHHVDPNEWENLADSPAHEATKELLRQFLPKMPAALGKHVSDPTNA